MRGDNMDFLRTFFGHEIDFTRSANMFTIHHVIYMLSAVLTIVFVWKFADKIKQSGKEPFLKNFWIGLLIVLEISYHIHNWTYPRFSIPLHICSFAVFMAIYFLITNSQRVFTYLFFFGTLGGIMALFFPVSWGYTYLNFRYYHFMILHCSIIAIPIYYFKAYQYRVTYHQLLQVFRTVLVVGILVHILNLTFINWGYDANYWFVTQIPSNVSSVFTSYPLYIVTHISAVFLSMNILYFATRDNITKELNKKTAQ
jgi:hypothetical integral membrane protein (TIGR02206 family)